MNYTTPTDATGTRFLIQYDHIGYLQIHSPTREDQNGLQARCIATHPDSPTEMVYSKWADAILLGEGKYFCVGNYLRGLINLVVLQ